MTGPQQLELTADSAEYVADLIEFVAADDSWPARSDTAPCHAVAAGDRLRAAGQVRPRSVGLVRAQLAAVDHDLLLSGAAVWLRRHRRCSASARAAARWQARP